MEKRFDGCSTLDSSPRPRPHPSLLFDIRRAGSGRRSSGDKSRDARVATRPGVGAEGNGGGVLVADATAQRGRRASSLTGASGPFALRRRCGHGHLVRGVGGVRQRRSEHRSLHFAAREGVPRGTRGPRTRRAGELHRLPTTSTARHGTARHRTARRTRRAAPRSLLARLALPATAAPCTLHS